MNNSRGVVVWLLPFLIGLLAGAVMQRYIIFDPVPSSVISKKAVSDFKLMAEAWNAIDEYYVDRASVKPRSMAYGAIAGMVNSLGDTGHSTFLDPAMVQAAQMIEEGKFAGIGAEIQKKDNQIVIVAPMDGTPAQKAGLHPGDIIVKVDGVNTSGLSLQETVRKILGPAGTRVTLTIKDPKTEKMQEIVITRANISLRSVTWHMLPGTSVAHLRIALFSKDTSPDVERALSEIEQRGATGLVLDLRNDPGGLLDMAVGVASQFLKTGPVLQEKNAKGAIHLVPLTSGAKTCRLPMVVLINIGTASASEIVAGALQDAGRATIVGETTFGTGTVLNSIPLSDGSAVLLAVMEWLTPKGRTIWHKGITPDVAVPLPAGASPLVPSAEGGMTSAELHASQDVQLMGALGVLEHTMRNGRPKT
ncbi:MAG TPA: S41 family peptidase [Nitrospirota bacterium]|nr:S41 family peptidase [Nitrospirota bacterium]